MPHLRKAMPTSYRYNCLEPFYAQHEGYHMNVALPCLLLVSSISFQSLKAAESLTNYSSHSAQSDRITVTTDSGQNIRIRAYGDAMFRVQAVQAGVGFLPDEHYEIVEHHNHGGALTLLDQGDALYITLSQSNRRLQIQKNPLRLSFFSGDTPLLTSAAGVSWESNTVDFQMTHDSEEHFCGLGHPPYGRLDALDLRNQETERNYGEGYDVDTWQPQAPLIVPFYLSNKGYGVFLNSTYHNRYSFGKNQSYRFGIDHKGLGSGELDFFFLFGPDFSSLLDRYTRLTGRPRFPAKSIFGLHLSDKGHPNHDGVNWWRSKITAHRAAGFPLDHAVNDNRWRSGSGAWSNSWFEWDAGRFPDPAGYAVWLADRGITSTLDLNRNICNLCEGWDSDYNMPGASSLPYNQSVPDFSRQDVRDWVWNLFWTKSFNPALGFPGEAIWMDEVDELHSIPDVTICGDGRTWAENENNYLYLIAKAAGADGWDNVDGGVPPRRWDRPWVWSRGMAAGGQRYASHWTGDTKNDYTWMKQQVRAMQASGLSGFPYFNHDAGGYRKNPGIAMYRQWAAALGSFSPIWRPHGAKGSRWPLDRTAAEQADFRYYSELRYQMMPYIYTLAHEASRSGLPMVRPMVLDYQNEAEAWERDLQFMWGDALLVAPNCSGVDADVPVWLPAGTEWYDFRSDERYAGGQVLNYPAPLGRIPLFVKSGAVIPRRRYALTTAWLDPGFLELAVYTGGDGAFTLYEDDGVSHEYRLTNAFAQTEIRYYESRDTLNVFPQAGTYAGAPPERSYHIRFHGLSGGRGVAVNGLILPRFAALSDAVKRKEGMYYDDVSGVLHVITRSLAVTENLTMTLQAGMPPILPSPQGHIYQAEEADQVLDVTFSDEHAGYTGTGFADYGRQNAVIEWRTVTAETAGLYTLTFRYANGSFGDRSCRLLMNDHTEESIAFSPTGGWAEWQEESVVVFLDAGETVINLSVITSAGGPNLDRMEVFAPERFLPLPVTIFNPNPQPAEIVTSGL